nr:hypothetical protein CISIN_1g003089mg [Ipomoea batatas]GMC87766.1 hypothetical protein CISIN_1g003089mg [Ipomoea batatas]
MITVCGEHLIQFTSTTISSVILLRPGTHLGAVFCVQQVLKQCLLIFATSLCTQFSSLFCFLYFHAFYWVTSVKLLT